MGSRNDNFAAHLSAAGDARPAACLGRTAPRHAADHTAVYRGYLAAPGQRHADAQLVADEFEHPRHTGATRRGEPVEMRLADQTAAGAERQGLQDVGAAAHAAVEQDRQFGAGRDDVGQYPQRRHGETRRLAR